MHIVIVGAGIAGLSAAWALAKRGQSVTLIEQGPIPNPLAASGDHHRIIRRAYSAASGYAPMISEAFDAWDELWADIGACHYDARGFAVFSQTAGDEGEVMRQGLNAGGFPYRLLVDEEWQAEFPFIERSSMRWGLVSPEGGALHCRHIARDIREWLAAEGVEILENAEVTAIDTATGTATLHDGTRIAGDLLLLTAGAWATRLWPALRASLAPFRTAVAYLTPPDDVAVAWNRAPVLLDLGGTIDGYIIPPSGGGGLKFGTGLHKWATEDASADRRAAAGEGAQILGHFRGAIRDISGYRVEDVVTCAYTFTSDETFFARAEGRTLAVSACSGHGYKFGAAVGRRIAAAVETGDTAALQNWLAAKG